MQKWAIVFSIFTVVVLSSRIVPFSETQRYPADHGIMKSCFDSLNALRSRFDRKRSTYESYLKKFQEMDEVPEIEKFSNTLEYIAWLDAKIADENTSLGKFLYARKSQSLSLKEFIIERSRPDKYLNYLFKDLFHELLIKSVKVEGLSKKGQYGLFHTVQEKLAKEALAKISEEPEGKFAKFMNGTFAKHAIDWLGFIGPIYNGLLPIRIPEILTENRARLFTKNTLEEMDGFYSRLNLREKVSLDAELVYNRFRRKYHFAVAIGYVVYSVYSNVEGMEANSIFKKSNDDFENSVEALINIGNSCYDYHQCLNDYRDDQDQVSLEDQEDCSIIYSVDDTTVCED